MDNKEAIKELSEWLDGCCGGEEIEPTRQALRLAISALQAQEAKTQLSAEGTTFDLISRQAAIDAILGITALRNTIPLDSAIFNIKKLPSAQPEIEERTEEFAQNVPKEDLISRKVAIDAVEHITSSMSVCVNTDECHGMKRMQRQAVIELANLPSAQLEMNLDEWCTDCKEYDHKRHCCPRWNRVIRQTLKDAQPEPYRAERRTDAV